MRRLRALLLGAIVAAGVSADGAAGRTRDRCATACTYVFAVGSQPREWQTPWAAGTDDTVAVVVTVAGHELRSRRLGGCAMTFRGRGVLVRADCSVDSAAPVRLRLSAVNERPSRVRVWIKRLPAAPDA